MRCMEGLNVRRSFEVIELLSWWCKARSITFPRQVVATREKKSARRMVIGVIDIPCDDMGTVKTGEYETWSLKGYSEEIISLWPSELVG